MRSIKKLLNIICALMLGTATAISFVNVILRFFFSSPISWAEEIAVFLFIMSVLLVQINIEAADTQLSVSFLTLKIKNKYSLTILNSFRKISVIVIYSLLVMPGLMAIKRSHLYDSATTVLRIPYWIGLTVLLAIIMIVIVINLTGLIGSIVSLRKNSSANQL